MKRLLLISFAALALTACEQQPAGEPVVKVNLGENAAEARKAEGKVLGEVIPVPGSACQPASFENVAIIHCVADPAKHRIETYAQPKPGSGGADVVDAYMPALESEEVFMVNGGMVDEGQDPLGYFVRGGERLGELNRGDGEGNFYLKPNGVFFGTGDSWRVLTSDRFYSTVSDRPQFGTQSGPMLVIDGELHPEIAEDGPSQAIRSAVGIDSDGKAHFVLSTEPLSFGKLARYYRDELKVENALTLGTTRSALYAPQVPRTDTLRAGPVIVIRQKDSAFEAPQ